LLAHRAGTASPPAWHFDIVLQGENETVFLDF
jgi:protocatechuate 3,4-dioxygenase beta subunit